MAIERTFKSDDGKRLPCRTREQRSEYHEPASGLRLRVTRRGARSWAVSYYSALARATRRLRLGDAALMSLSRARSLARRALQAVADGDDPHAERLAARQRERDERRRRAGDRARSSLTVGALCRRYMEHRQSVASGRYGRTARPQTALLWESMLRLHVEPAIGSRAVESVTTGELVRVVEGAVKRAGPTMGPRVRDFLAAVWRWAQDRTELCEAMVPNISWSSLRRIGRDEAKRARVLRPAGIWRFWRATEEEGEGLLDEALRFSLLPPAE